MISVVIPVRNGGADLVRCLEGVARQQVEDAVEVIVLDSASTDGSDQVARSYGARVESVDPGEFNHGATRNEGARLARGELLVFTSQDAYAIDERWLARLAGPLAADPRLAGVYGRQLAHEHATPPEVFFLDFVYGPESRVQRAASVHEVSMATTLFSNANAAIRRSVWEEFPFASDIIMSEDQEWSRRVLLAGWEIRYEAEAVVRHSHPYTIPSAFRRFFDSGVSAERAYLAGGRPSAEVVRRRAFRYAREELGWMWRKGHRRWIPYTVVYELAKFLGLQLGARHRRLPRWLKLRMTALPTYWQRAGGA